VAVELALCGMVKSGVDWCSGAEVAGVEGCADGVEEFLWNGHCVMVVDGGGDLI